MLLLSERENHPGRQSQSLGELSPSSWGRHGIDKTICPAALCPSFLKQGTLFNILHHSPPSGDGYVVVGSQDGRVRLYSESTLTQARTSIPSLGYPITDVDVTYDGRWVVATAAHYLMVVMTTYRPPGSEATLCGFTSRMGANSPAPRLLRLRLEDALRTVNKGFMSNFCVIGHASMARPSRAMAGNVCAARRRRAFSRTQSDESLSTTHRLGLIPSQGNKPLQKGRFTWVTERGRQERWVVASCGSYTVRWNLRVVKTANAQTVSGGGLTTVDQYQLLSKEEHVVDSAFMHDNFARSEYLFLCRSGGEGEGRDVLRALCVRGGHVVRGST